MKKHLVYFFSVNDTFVKVGCTCSTLYQRFDALQVGCPYPIKAEGIIQCSSKEEMQETESKFKQDFANFHKHGEWYYLSQSVSEFISNSTENADKEIEVSRQEFLAYRRQKYKNTPELSESQRERRHKRKLKRTPEQEREHRNRINKRKRERYRNDPEYREKQKKYHRELYHKNKQKGASE